MGRLKEYTFKEDPRVIELLDLVAIRRKTTRGALIRSIIRSFLIDHFTKEEPKKLRVIE